MKSLPFLPSTVLDLALAVVVSDPCSQAAEVSNESLRCTRTKLDQMFRVSPIVLPTAPKYTTRTQYAMGPVLEHLTAYAADVRLAG